MEEEIDNTNETLNEPEVTILGRLNNPPLLECDQCDYKTTNKNALRMHKSRTHGHLRGQPRHMAKAKARKAELARRRTARLNALGLNSRGKPKVPGGATTPSRRDPDASRRDPEKQRQWQANYYKKHQAARAMLGLTFRQFETLPKEERIAAMQRAFPKLREPYVYSNEMEAKQQQEATTTTVPTLTIKFCPECGHSLEQYRK